jgi:uncharacterized protein YggE
MESKTALSAVLVAGLLVAAGVAGAVALGAGPAAANQPADSSKSITVSATGDVEATPDQAVVRVAVTATGNDSTSVREELATDVESVRDALEEYGVPSDGIRTAYFDIRQERERTRSGTEYGDYRGVHALEITTDDTEAAGELIDLAVDNGADQIDGVSFTLSDEKREQLHNDALEAAMGNAETRADTLASSGDLAVTGVHSIHSADTGYRPYRMETAYVSAAGDAAGGTAVQSGPVTVTADVRVTYNATSA